MTEHYFSAAPATPDERHLRTVSLRGHTVEVETAAGVFSHGGVDKGTAVLLDEVPDPPAQGTFLDIGCGWGPIALSLALAAPTAEVWALDVNERALDLCRRNADRGQLSGIRTATAEHIPAGAKFDVIWSNPPIRVGKAVLHDLLRTWLPRLTAEGVAYLVVQKNLGSDSLQRWITDDLGMPCTRLTTAKGFRVLQVTHR